MLVKGHRLMLDESVLLALKQHSSTNLAQANFATLKA